MQCPKCQAAMERIPYQSSHVDRCSQCRGLWFEMVEHERLKDAAAQLDVGDAAVGARYNRVDRIDCPVCTRRPLVRMVDAQQPHLWFESCQHCHGRFYDAGEYRDFAERSFLEFFRDLDAPERA